MAEMAMPGMMPSPQNEMTPENLAAFEQMRQDVSPTEFNEELLSAASEADPIAVAEFKAELRGLELPPEVLSVLDQMVDEILANPGDYAMIRAKYMEQDIPEDLLPPTFDPEFFGAMNIALDEIRATSGMQTAPMAFAKGGLASLNPIAAEMARAGRYGDTMLAHISPREASVLRQMGGSGTINPYTGLPEFFIKKLFKGVGKVFKKVGKAIKKFASSTVGRIVTSIALGFLLGPAAANFLGVTSTVGTAAVSGFVGGAGSTLAAGGNLKDALKTGAVSGLTAGAISGVTGGADAFKAGSYQGPTTVGGQFAKAKEFLGFAPRATPAPIADAVGQGGALPDVGASAETFAADMPQSLEFTPRLPAQTTSARTLADTAGTPFSTGADPFAVPTQPTAQALKTASAPKVPPPKVPPPKVPPPQGPVASAPPTFMENLIGAVKPGDNIGFFEGLKDAFSPSEVVARMKYRAREGLMNRNGVNSYEELVAKSASDPALAKEIANLADVGAGMSKYIPLAGAGLGVMGLTGGFEEEEAESPLGIANMMTGEQLLAADPARYGINIGPMYTTYSGYGSMPLAQPRRAAHGGEMTRKEFPRKNGHISGPGTGTSDDIPAMLSDGEFVFTAKAVKSMGDGSRRKGAKRMYALMKRLEGQMA
jgi:hypothetical protein